MSVDSTERMDMAVYLGVIESSLRPVDVRVVLAPTRHNFQMKCDFASGVDQHFMDPRSTYRTQLIHHRMRMSYSRPVWYR